MNPNLLLILAAVAIVCLGLAQLIGHAIVSQVLSVAGTVFGGVVLVFLMVQ